jgi:hypothetical protein
MHQDNRTRFVLSIIASLFSLTGVAAVKPTIHPELARHTQHFTKKVYKVKPAARCCRNFAKSRTNPFAP